MTYKNKITQIFCSIDDSLIVFESALLKRQFSKENTWKFIAF
jgi:hypothetical protein